MLHARCVVEALARGVTPAPLRDPAVSCRAKNPRRDALEAAVQADAGLCNRAARMAGGNAGDATQATRTYAAGGFGMDRTRTAWV